MHRRSQRSVRWQAAFAAGLLCGCASGATLELAPCVLTAAEGRVEAPARCGRLPVPLNPQDPAGAAIELSVAVAPALAEQAAASPLVVLAGGPGDAATRFFAASRPAFADIRATRDIVLVDQRGTGASAPLRCANMDAWPMHEALAATVEATVAAVRECRATLEWDSRWFTTSAAVRDLELVRAALGYEAVNLYGISYGTRVAQHYQRRYPERVQAVILDGVLPPSLALGPDMAIESQAALDAVFERCAEDAPCRAAFPEARERFQALLTRLEAAPPQLVVPHPRTGEGVSMALTREAAVGAVRLLLYAPQTASLLPALLDAAHAAHYPPLAAQFLSMASGLAELAVGLNFAVLCTEDVPFWGALDREALRETYLGATFVDAQRGICESWPAGFMDDNLKAPLASGGSEAPTLILSGEFDPVTPPRYARLVGESLSRVTVLEGKGQGHGLLGVSCVPRLMAAFLDNAHDPQWRLDASCLERVGPVPIFASAMGPGP